VRIPIDVDRESVQAFEKKVFVGADEDLAWERPAVFESSFDRLDLIHALVTWGRTSKGLTLHLGDGVDSPERLRAYLAADELLIAALMARRVVVSSGRSVNADVRQALKAELQRRRFLPGGNGHRTIVLSTLDASMSYSPDVMSGEPPFATTDLPARTRFFRIDMEPYGRDERKMLVGAGEVLSRDAHGREWLTRDSWPATHPLSRYPFTPLGHRILRPTLEMNLKWQQSAHPVGSTAADWLGQALWEIFQNSEHHALASAKLPIPRAIRMLMATSIEQVNDVSDESPVAAYMARMRRQLGVGTTFVETSVIDSGDGLAYTAAARAGIGALSEPDEITFLKRAVRGESHSPDRPMHGFGMPVVAQLLSDAGGFMRIRSGSLSVWRDFDDKRSSYSKRDSPLDWTFDLEDASTPYRRFGSIITIVLPRYGHTA
jgi:hypothetical protein